jgi:hypothetical protein
MSPDLRTEAYPPARRQTPGRGRIRPVLAFPDSRVGHGAATENQGAESSAHHETDDRTKLPGRAGILLLLMMVFVAIGMIQLERLADMVNVLTSASPRL